MKKFIVSLLILLIFFACAHSGNITKQQSLIIDLTFQCEEGKQSSCDKLPQEIEKLNKMLEK